MSIEFACSSCGKKLRVNETAAGKRVRCSGCQTVLQVPAASSAPAPRPAAPSRPKPRSQNFHVKTGDGQMYGPVSKEELDSWFTEGRLTAESQVLREGSDQWQWATDLYPQLSGAPQPAPAAPGPEPANPFDFAAADASPTARTRRGRPGGSPWTGADTPGGSPYTPPSGQSAAATGGAAKRVASEPAWYSVLDGLLIAMVCLAVAFVCFFVLAVGRLWVENTSSMSRGAASALLKVAFWATLGLACASVSMVTGWCLCLKVPRRARADIPIRIAVGAVGGLLLLMLIMQLVPSMFKPERFDFDAIRNLARMLKVIGWLAQVVAVGGLVAFGFFLFSLGKFYSHRQLPLLAVCYAAFAGVHVIWMTIETFVVESGKTMDIVVGVLFLIFGLGHFGCLAYMTFTAREAARRAVARNERG